MPRNDLLKNAKSLALQALFPMRRGLLPARELLREFRSLGLPPLLFPALQVGRIRGGGGLRVHLVLCPVRLPPLPLGLSLARGGWGSVSGHSSVARERASVSSAPSGAGKGKVARSQRMPPARAASSVSLPAHRRTLDDVVSWEKFRRTAPTFDPPVVPNLRIEEHGRIGELALGRTALMTVAVALTPLPVKRLRASKAVILSVAVLPQAVAIFGSLPLSFSERPVSILGSIPLSP